MNSVSELLTFSGSILAALLIFSLLKKEKSEHLRLFLFSGMTAAIAVTTVFLIASTIAKNQSSATGGPVHWHADYEIYNCGEKIDLIDPRGLANRIGTPDLHEHGDNRIHVEGTVQDLSDVSLASFFEVVGGKLAPGFLNLPTNQGEFAAQNGMECENKDKGVLQVFVYKTKNGIANQKKLANFTDYVLSPQSLIPPGDCIIIEFGPEKQKTDKICKFYQIAIQKGELKLIE